MFIHVQWRLVHWEDAERVNNLQNHDQSVINMTRNLWLHQKECKFKALKHWLYPPFTVQFSGIQCTYNISCNAVCRRDHNKGCHMAGCDVFCICIQAHHLFFYSGRTSTYRAMLIPSVSHSYCCISSFRFNSLHFIHPHSANSKPHFHYLSSPFTLFFPPSVSL